MKPFYIIAAFFLLLCASCRTAERTVQTAATQLAVRTDRIAAMRHDTVYISRTDTLRLYRSERNDTRGIPGSAVKLCLCLAAFAVLFIIVWIKKKKTW